MVMIPTSSAVQCYLSEIKSILTIDEPIAGTPRVAGAAGAAAAAHCCGGGDAGHHAAGLGPAPVPQHRPGPRRHLRLDTALPRREFVVS